MMIVNRESWKGQDEVYAMCLSHASRLRLVDEVCSQGPVKKDT